MKSNRKLSYIALILVALISSNSAMAQNAAITIQVLTLAGANKISPGTPPTVQPAPGVSIYVLVGANKFSTAMPPTGTTNSTGAFVFPPGLLSAAKPHTQMEVYEVCVNGQKAIFVIPKGTEDQLPKDTDDCKKRRLGFFWLDGGPNVIVDLANGVVTQTGTGTAVTSNPPKPHIPVFIQVGGGVGFKNFAGISGNCVSYQQIFPGGTCSNSTNSFAFDLGGSLNVWHAVLGGGYFRANNVQLNGSGSVPGGGTDTLTSTMQPQAGYLTGGFRIPIGSKFSLVPEGGAAFWRINLKRTEMVTMGSSTPTSTDSGQSTGTGPMAGLAVHLDVTPRVGFEVRYDWMQMSNKPLVNEHDNLFLFNVTFRWPRK